MRSRLSRHYFLTAATAFLLASTSVKAQTNWTGAASGNWADSGNWTSGVPGAGLLATFNAASPNTTISLGGAAQSVGSIIFDTASAASYTFSAGSGSALRFDAAGGVNVNAGVTTAQTFAVAIENLGALNLTNNGSGLVTYSGGFSLAPSGSAGQMGVSGTGNTVISGSIGTSFTGLQKTGSGVLTLSAANTYAGSTSIAGGTLSFSNVNQLGDSTQSTNTFTISGGGTLSYTGAAGSTDRLWSLGTSGGTLDASGTGAISFTNTGAIGFNGQSGARTLTLSGTNTGNNTLAASIGDNGGATSLTKTGNGTWVLSGTSTYTGVTTISAGILSVSSITNGGVAGPLGASSSDPANLVLSGGTLQYSGSSAGVTDRGMTLSSNSSIGVSNATSLTLNGVIAGSGSLTKVGSTTGDLILAGNNTFTGNVTVSSGKLTLKSSSSLGTGTKTVTVATAATALGSVQLDPGAGGVIDLPSSISWVTSGTTANPIYNVSGNNVIRGDITLNNTGGDSRFTVAGGSLAFSGSSISPSTPATNLQLYSASGTSGSTSNVISNGATFALGVTKADLGTWTLSGANTHNGSNSINAGTLILGHAQAQGFGAAINTTVSGQPTRSSVVSGGTLDLNGQSPYGRQYWLSGTGANGQGALINSNTSVESVIGADTVSGLSLATGSSGYSAPPTVTVSGGGGSGAAVESALGITLQSVTLTSGGSGYTGSPTVTITGGGPNATGARVLAQVSGGVVTGLVLQSPGIGYTSAPTITIAPPASGTAATAVANGSNFAVTGLRITNPGSGYTSAPTLTFSHGNASATSILTTVFLPSAATIGGPGNIRIDAPISGAFPLTKSGAGQLTLTAASTYTGGTTVSAGTLRVSNTSGSATGTGLVTVVGTGSVGSGGAITGTGIISGGIKISDEATASLQGGKLSPGSDSTIGTLNVSGGTSTWNPGGTYKYTYDVQSNAGDLLNGTGGSSTLSLANLSTTAGKQFAIDLTPLTSATGLQSQVTYTIATFNSLTLPSGFSGTDLTPYFTFTGQFLTQPTATLSGNSVQISFQPAPEPAHILLISGMGVGAFRFWRRRQGT